MSNVILGALAAGFDTVTFSDTNAHDKVTVGSDFTRNLTINLDADTDGNEIAASAYTEFTDDSTHSDHRWWYWC